MKQHDALKTIHLFNGASDSDLHSLQSIVERRSYMAGEHVYTHGDTADAIYFVESGTVDLVPGGKDVPFATIGSGQTFGELAFFDHGTRPVSASVRERSHVLRIPYVRLNEVLAGRPDLALLVYRNACVFLAKHFRALAKELSGRYL